MKKCIKIKVRAATGLLMVLSSAVYAAPPEGSIGAKASLSVSNISPLAGLFLAGFALFGIYLFGTGLMGLAKPSQGSQKQPADHWKSIAIGAALFIVTGLITWFTASVGEDGAQNTQQSILEGKGYGGGTP